MNLWQVSHLDSIICPMSRLLPSHSTRPTMWNNFWYYWSIFSFHLKWWQILSEIHNNLSDVINYTNYSFCFFPTRNLHNVIMFFAPLQPDFVVAGNPFLLKFLNRVLAHRKYERRRQQQQYLGIMLHAMLNKSPIIFNYTCSIHFTFHICLSLRRVKRKQRDYYLQRKPSYIIMCTIRVKFDMNATKIYSTVYFYII